MLPSKEVYIVYQTTNKINNKFYIGVHRCKDNNKFDEYLGSGSLLHRAIAKYGKHNFRRETLYVCSSYKEAYMKERELVTLDLIESNNCYNVRLGGDGGSSPNLEVRKTMSLARKGRFTKEENHFYGKKHTEETRKKLSDIKRGQYVGEKNPNWKGGVTKNKFNSVKERMLAQSVFMTNNNPMSDPDVRKKHSESIKNRPTVVCPHCQKTMNNGGFTVHAAALARKGIIV